MSERDLMDLFQQACGASGPLQLRLEVPGSAGVECRRFAAPFVVIGRDPHSDLVLDHKEVCPRHAYLQALGGRLYCLDLGSRSGVSLGGQIRRAGWVEPEQAIRIGPYRLRYVPYNGESRNLNACTGGNPLPLTLELLHRGFKSSECQVSAGLSLVGSATDCQVRLLDPGVASMHCSLLSTPLGVWVVDLLARGGIEVNGTPVRYARLEPGDELRVGRSTIRIRPVAASRATAPAVTAPALAPQALRPPALAPQALRPKALRPKASRAITNTPRALTPHAAPHQADFLAEPDSEPAEAPFWSTAGYEAEPEPELETETETGSRLLPERSARHRQVAEEQSLAGLSAQERRTSCRYPVVNAEAVLSWWEPTATPLVVLSAPREEPKLTETEATIYGRVMARWPGNRNGTPSARAASELARDPLPPVEESMQSRVCGVRILDISQTGLLVLSPTVPPADGRIWLRLETPQITDWVEVVVKGATPEPTGAHRIRLAFHDACPYDFFKAVVYTRPAL